MEMDKSDIKIFVSRRIDLDSVTIDNPLFVPVRCGAVYDEDKSSPYFGDDTGDNISSKRITFSELTVQYWAWKNVKADWYGLCHYRRYISFSEKKYKTGAHGLVVAPILNEKNMRRYNLLDEQQMRREIEQYDIIMPCGAPVANIILPHGRAQTVGELWAAHDGFFFYKDIINHMFSLIDELTPEYSDSAKEYFLSSNHYGYNCYIMRRELFEQLCNFQFPIIEEMAKEMDGSNDLKQYPRAIAYVGEMLFGVFLYHIKKSKKYKAKERQIVIFEETKKLDGLMNNVKCYLVHVINRVVWKASLYLFPLGSKRREKWKNYYNLLLRKN